MLKKISKIFMVFTICNIMTIGVAGKTLAAQESGEGSGTPGGTYLVTVEVPVVNINREYATDDVLQQAYEGENYRVLQDMGDGWLKVAVNDTYGYIPQDGNTSVVKMEEASTEVLAELAAADAAAANRSRRQDLVNYAMQFVGGRYAYGGSDPRTGVDCSGFTKYVMQHGAGINISRSSQSQASQGISIGADQMQPGDLIFYGNGRSINHVAMYIGNGQVVHASTSRTGIKVSGWNYRQPIRIVNVMGDI